MHRNKTLAGAVMALMFAAAAGMASAKLPLPNLTPEQAALKAEKKAKADAQADQDKQNLLASMDNANKRWRSKAAANGLQTYAATPVAAPVQALLMPATQSPSPAQPGGARAAGSGEKAAAAPGKKAPLDAAKK